MEDCVVHACGVLVQGCRRLHGGRQPQESTVRVSISVHSGKGGGPFREEELIPARPHPFEDGGFAKPYVSKYHAAVGQQDVHGAAVAGQIAPRKVANPGRDSSGPGSAKIQPAGIVDDGNRGRSSGREGQSLAQIDIAVGTGDGNGLVAGGDPPISSEGRVVEDADDPGVADENAGEIGLTNAALRTAPVSGRGLDRNAAIAQIGYRTAAFTGIGQRNDGGCSVGGPSKSATGAAPDRVPAG